MHTCIQSHNIFGEKILIEIDFSVVPKASVHIVVKSRNFPRVTRR